MGVDFLTFLGNVEHRHHDKVVLNVISNITIKKEFHCVMTRESQMHSKEIANQGSEVCFHCVLHDKNLVLFQPGVHFLSKLQVLKADCGFKGNKVDKLFLDGIGLQVDGILAY
jgi:hypothetical protein